MKMNRRLATANTKILIGGLIILAIAVAIIAVVRFDTTGKKGSGLGQEFIYDVGDLGKIDPNLILYKESAPPINTHFTESRAIALAPKGTIYVAGDKDIRKFDENGNGVWDGDYIRDGDEVYGTYNGIKTDPLEWDTDY